ncbi:aldehyde dehydrogenase family protein [Actinoalloteichus hymeniacidonis]|uniref:aldehyde dehydrogenase (NAD(+)) n=1 Tax=Actinoalloteichus hymeniacidonis TaxID=340345 RepID=A0AAC9MX36_9PSEU|nr:aldehyde dehydrogenase family protein [Actinoalloteichus hymeniacidonis]AOS61920.1 NAD-dependent aldehyde dehydrogenase [Actinoalloteichus hymeniacidonis]MBB5910060.1 phenylacetaldehyde dehydrogenase [Actinoalloteichus hymeniacidonis]
MSESDAGSIRELIGGTAGIPAGELTQVLTDPNTGAALYPQRATTPENVEKALATAWRVHTEGVWAELPRADRAAALRRLQAELTERVDELARADSLDNGTPTTFTAMFTGGVIGLLELAASQIEDGFGHTEQVSATAGVCDQWRLPWGPAAVFLPWNAPSSMAIMKTASALVAGAPIVIKPSEWAPHFSGAFAEAVQAALPEGVVQIVHGDRTVGQTIVADERIAAVSYTGGVQGGRAVAQTCARDFKPIDMELSGNNPVIALPDADPTSVAEQLAPGMVMLNGQFCIGPRRLIVPESQIEAYLEALAAVLSAVPIGATDDPAAQLGPLAHEQQRNRIEEQLEQFAALGCEVRRYGKLPGLTGHFFAPAVVLADQSADLKDEIFGPVIQVRTYRDVDEAVTIANDHAYGLSGYVFGADRDTARAVGKRLRSGVVTINSVLGAPADVPRVGSMWGISGLGEIGVGHGPNFFGGLRFVG